MRLGKTVLLSAGSLVLMLSACGGGDGSTPNGSASLSNGEAGHSQGNGNTTAQIPVIKPYCVINRHTKPVTGVAFSSDGKYLVSSSRDGTIRKWDADSGVLLHSDDSHDGQVGAMAASKDLSFLAFVGESLEIHILEYGP
ncbi:MAG: hypothetical protein KDB29_11575, partial [Planctomycetes bacterium]|nr:hypothetical protein [Planctomycetota bacterium]